MSLTSIKEAPANGHMPLATHAAETRNDIMKRLAERQLAPWPLHTGAVGHPRLNDPTVYIFEIRDRVVSCVRSDTFHAITGGFEENSGPYVCRAFHYLQFFRRIASRHAIPDCNFVLDTKDCAQNCSESPLFTFQRDGDKNILLPDVDFLSSNFYQDKAFWGLPDSIPFVEKTTSAIFSGATTGAGLITRQTLKGGQVPRVEAARFFRRHDNVTFLLPVITQASAEAEEDLRSEGFGGGRITWDEQMKHKFLISIDGNGATCSRVYISLISNCVLVKYDSPHEMFYFDALQPGVHYISVKSHQDVVRVIQNEKEEPGRYQCIAVEGQLFAKALLNLEALQYYTACVLRRYAESQVKSSISGIFRERGKALMFKSAGLDYTQFIATLAQKRKASIYLEVGVHTGANFSRISVKDAVGVDPAFCLNQDVLRGKQSVRLYNMSSDYFFKETEISGFDLAFLDGMHLFEYLLRDFFNTENRSTPTALILIHDCLPYEESMLCRDEVSGGWTGDVWKIVPLLQKYRPDLTITLIDCSPTGLVAVSGIDPSSTYLRDNYQSIVDEFAAIPNNRQELENFYAENDIKSSVSILLDPNHSL